MQGRFLTIQEAKKDAKLQLDELYKKMIRVEAFVLKNPNDTHAQKKLKGMNEYIEYLKCEINNFENIENIVGVNERWDGLGLQ